MLMKILATLVLLVEILPTLVSLVENPRDVGVVSGKSARCWYYEFKILETLVLHIGENPRDICIVSGKSSDVSIVSENSSRRKHC